MPKLANDLPSISNWRETCQARIAHVVGTTRGVCNSQTRRTMASHVSNLSSIFTTGGHAHLQSMAVVEQVAGRRCARKVEHHVDHTCGRKTIRNSCNKTKTKRTSLHPCRGALSKILSQLGFTSGHIFANSAKHVRQRSAAQLIRTLQLRERAGC